MDPWLIFSILLIISDVEAEAFVMTSTLSFVNFHLVIKFRISNPVWIFKHLIYKISILRDWNRALSALVITWKLFICFFLRSDFVEPSILKFLVVQLFIIMLAQASVISVFCGLFSNPLTNLFLYFDQREGSVLSSNVEPFTLVENQYFYVNFQLNEMLKRFLLLFRLRKCCEA